MSLLGGRHVKRPREAYELALLWLSIMKDRAWEDYLKTEGPHLPRSEWENHLNEACPTINYWGTVDEFLKSYFMFLRAQRLGNWNLTLGTILNFLGWFFAFDRVNYQRATAWFLRDMSLLPQTHPDVHAAFEEGLFCVQRSYKKFSMMPLDQSHEHSVELSKEDGRNRGLYYAPEEKEINDVSGPEVLRVIREF